MSLHVVTHVFLFLIHHLYLCTQQLFATREKYILRIQKSIDSGWFYKNFIVKKYCIGFFESRAFLVRDMRPGQLK